MADDLDPLVVFLRSCREAKGLSMREIHRRCGIYQSQLSDWETGAKAPSLRSLRRWVAALDMSLEEAVIGAARKVRREAPDAS